MRFRSAIAVRKHFRESSPTVTPPLSRDMHHAALERGNTGRTREMGRARK